MMDKYKKIDYLFHPGKMILLSDFLATEPVKEAVMNFLGIDNERDFLDFLEVDFYYLSFRDLSQNESLTPFYTGSELWCDEQFRNCPFGIKWRRKVYMDKFGVDEAVEGPFSSFETTEEDILNYNWPDPAAFDYSGLVKECEDFKDKIIIGGLWSGIHGDSNRLMGYENFLLNIAMNKSLVKVLINRVTEFYLEANRHYFEALKGKMDIFFMGNDFGSQNGLLISEADWYELYYENYKKLIDLAHSYGLKVMVHSCGSIIDLLPHFKNLGVDIIDPVQTTASGMTPENLIRDYGRAFVFHGAIDTQHVLPNKGSDEVYNYSVKMIESMNKFGGYVVAPSNNFMPGTAVENILAVYSAAKTWKKNNC